jgi:formylglycine-generating enzyme
VNRNLIQGVAASIIVRTTNDQIGTVIYGSVTHDYRMGKYDVTIGQYVEFLNSVAANDTYGLYNSSMTTDLNIAGIAQSGAPGNYTYSAIGSPNKPVTYVSWGDASRFVNWLHNGQPTGAEDAGTTETGAYTLNGAVSDAALLAIGRNAGARWFLPTESEWYKAAYYRGFAGDYNEYTTSTLSPPSAGPPGNAPHLANFYNGFFAVTGSPTYDPSQNYLTDVGAYSASADPYGTFDEGGNVFQWNEAIIDGMYRGVRGGAWRQPFWEMSSSYRGINNPSEEDSLTGFRVATIPEPSTTVLTIVAICLTWWWQKRFNS